MNLNFEFSFFHFMALASLDFMFGYVQILSDGHNDNILNCFDNAGAVFCAIWGGIGYILMTSDSIVTITHLAILLYWVYKLKAGHVIHAVPVTVMLLGAFYSGVSDKGSLYVILLLASYILCDYLGSLLSAKQMLIKQFFRYKLHLIAIPVVFSLFVDNYLGIEISFILLGIYTAQRNFEMQA